MKTGVKAVHSDPAVPTSPAEPARPGRMAWCPSIWVVLASLAVIVWIAVDLVADGPIRRFDHVVADLMWDTGVREDPVGGVIGFIFSQAGGRGTNLVWVVGLCAVIAVRQRTLGPLARLVVGMALLSAVIYGAKFFFGRTAPAFGADLLYYPTGQSFPSGHQANVILISGIGAWIVLEYLSAGWVRKVVLGYAMLAPVAAAVAVLLMNYHWFSDVVAGMAVGLILLWVVHVVFAGRLGELTWWPKRWAGPVVNERGHS